MANASPRRQGLEGHSTVYQALDRAFANRISRCFNSMCDTFEEDHATALFLQQVQNSH